MTDRNGNVASRLINSIKGAPTQSGRGGSLARFVSGANSILLIYKNEGWYSIGSVWETWITSGTPSTVPPSGHALSFIQHMVLQ